MKKGMYGQDGFDRERGKLESQGRQKEAHASGDEGSTNFTPETTTPAPMARSKHEQATTFRNFGKKGQGDRHRS